MRALPAQQRLLLTGTPIQNNLEELWALFDWTTSGTLLGEKSTFISEFAAPIAATQDKDATAHDP